VKANGLYHAVLYVRDLQRSLAFWRDLLGFEVIGDAFAGRAAALVGADRRTHHELLLIEVGDAPGPDDAWGGAVRGRRRGLYHLGVKVGDSREELRAARDALAAAGVAVDGASDHTVTWSLYVRDPDGNEVELYCDDPAVDWRADPAAVMAPIRPLRL
jgi:catechol 2,3-dioxygenase